MSRTTLPMDPAVDHLRITAWNDPLVDAVGHELRSAYVERFWLSLLGPSTTLLLRHIATQLDQQPDGFDLNLPDTASALGLGLRGGLNGPFFRAIARTGQFHISRAAGNGELEFRRRLQSLTHRQVDRLSPALQDEHRRWVETSDAAQPSEVSKRRERARRLALSLLELGEPAGAVERQLHSWQIHPAMAHDALRWATARHGVAVPDTAVTPPSGASEATPTLVASADAVTPRPPTPAAARSQSGRPIPPPPRHPRPVFGPGDDAA